MSKQLPQWLNEECRSNEKSQDGTIIDVHLCSMEIKIFEKKNLKKKINISIRNEHFLLMNISQISELIVSSRVFLIVIVKALCAVYLLNESRCWNSTLCSTDATV